MKALYVATNGWVGESYVRAYVWADSEAEAKTLATAAFEKANPKYLSNGIKVEKLFSADAESFASQPSDDGFRMVQDGDSKNE